MTTVPVMTVTGALIAARLSWLRRLYAHEFRSVAETVFQVPVRCAEEALYGINLNVQRGSQMRYECHVDSNPIGALLYATTHVPGSGGELVVANRGDVQGVGEIDKDCSRIYPVAGHLILFDARFHSHYVAPLRSPDGLRIVAAMNYYTPTAPESLRPLDLDEHLFGSNPAIEELQLP